MHDNIPQLRLAEPALDTLLGLEVLVEIAADARQAPAWRGQWHPQTVARALEREHGRGEEEDG